MSVVTRPRTATTGPTARDRRFGLATAGLAAITLGVFARVDAAVRASLALNDARGGTLLLPDIVLPVRAVTLTIGVALVVLAAVHLTRGIGSLAVRAVALAGGLFTFALVAWAAQGETVSVIALLRGTLFAAVPITLGALAGVVSERSGVINIAIEGQFLVSACTAAVVGSVFASAFLGLVGGIIASVALSLALAVLAIRYRADQIVSGVVLTLLATGLTSFITSQVLSPRAELNGPPRFVAFDVPLLGDIPVIGPVVFRQTVLVYVAVVAVIVLQFALFRTRWGLRLRAVGEHPRAADTVGIPVIATRYRAVVLGGVLAGIGGSWFTLEAASQFSKEMTGGRGFIALAAMLVGRYSPVGALSAALLFGFADAMATTMQRLAIPIPSTLLRSTPYVITLVIVAGLIGRLRVPAADGKPYVRE